jgi:hypothetical protein
VERRLTERDVLNIADEVMKRQARRTKAAHTAA